MFSYSRDVGVIEGEVEKISEVLQSKGARVLEM